MPRPSSSVILTRSRRGGLAAGLRLALLASAVGVAIPGSASASLVSPVFQTNFESGLPAEISAPGASIVPVQGYAGLGSTGPVFGGQFLRYDALDILPTRLTLRGLPPHTHLDLGFLLGVIDSWDGTELLQVSVDGTLLFSHSFQLATGDTSSYDAPPNGLLSRGVELGFSLGSYYARDRAYNLFVEPAFQFIPHTADSVVVEWNLNAIPGSGASFWQGGADESWAMDELRVYAHGPGFDDVPAERGGRRLALAAPSPNPASWRALRVRLSLASDAPAGLTLHDLAGRRVRSQSWSAPSAGPRQVDLSAGERLAPGVYFLHLRQGRDSRTARVVIAE